MFSSWMVFKGGHTPRPRNLRNLESRRPEAVLRCVKAASLLRARAAVRERATLALCKHVTISAHKVFTVTNHLIRQFFIFIGNSKVRLIKLFLSFCVRTFVKHQHLGSVVAQLTVTIRQFVSV